MTLNAPITEVVSLYAHMVATKFTKYQLCMALREKIQKIFIEVFQSTKIMHLCHMKTVRTSYHNISVCKLGIQCTSKLTKSKCVKICRKNSLSPISSENL